MFRGPEKLKEGRVLLASTLVRASRRGGNGAIANLGPHLDGIYSHHGNKAPARRPVRDFLIRLIEVRRILLNEGWDGAGTEQKGESELNIHLGFPSLATADNRLLLALPTLPP